MRMQALKKDEDMKFKIVYVILHYNAYDMTCQCVETIMENCGKNSEIVIVDNCSPDESGIQLQEYFVEKKNVHVILSRENLGFAKGNNLGFFYAKNKLCANVIIDINNDILIKQKDFEKKLKSIIINNPQYAIVAPDILNRKGFHQNPLRTSRLISSYILKSLIKHMVYLCCLYTRIAWKKMYNIYHKNDATSRMTMKSREEIVDVIPHGSCVIFTPKFIEETDFAFVPITFFYAEEDILYDYLTISNMKSFYTNELCVIHMEKVSTESISKNVLVREKFLIRNKINSKIAILRYRIKNNIL